MALIIKPVNNDIIIAPTRTQIMSNIWQRKDFGVTSPYLISERINHKKLQLKFKT